MEHIFDDSRCKELQNALYAPFNPYIKWGTYIAIAFQLFLILVSFFVYTTSHQTISVLYGGDNSKNDGYFYLELVLPNDIANIRIGDKVSIVENDNNISCIGEVVEQNQSSQQYTISVRLESLPAIRPRYTLCVLHKMSIGETILSYILR